jgi:hypothetical protein
MENDRPFFALAPTYTVDKLISRELLPLQANKVTNHFSVHCLIIRPYQVLHI